jgi:acyl-homoserine-lactone acylase
LSNPRTGYLQNANDAPWYANLEQRIKPARFDGYIDADGLGWRSQLSLQILSSERRLTLDRLMRHKYNSEVPFADRLRHDLLDLIHGRAEGTGERQDAAAILEAWDGHVDADSRGAALFLTWWDVYAQSTGGKPFRTPWSAADPIHTPTGLADTALAADALDRAMAIVRQRYGRVDVVWGDVHRLRKGRVDLPVGGMPDTLQNIQYRIDSDGKLVAAAGDSYVLAVEFTDGAPKAYSIVPYSESSDPRSAHFTDQASLYANHAFKPAWFSEADIAANLAERYHPNR